MHFEFHLFQIPVRVRAWFVVTAFALGLVYPGVGMDPARLGVFMLVLGSALLAHELGHALAAKAYGWGPRIELGFIGVTQFDHRTETTRARRVLMIALGPLVGISIGAMAWSVPPGSHSLATFTLEAIKAVNLLWGFANLIPILPLDGGHILEELVTAVRPDQPWRGKRIAAFLSITFCVSIAAFATYHHELAVALVAMLFAWRNHRMLDALEQDASGMSTRLGGEGGSPSGAGAGSGWGVRSGITSSRIRARDLAYVALTRSDAVAVVKFARRAVVEASSVEDADEASYLLAWGLFLTGDAPGARDALAAISPARARDYALEGAIAHDLGELEDSLSLFERALPRATPFVEPRMVHAIVETRRFEDAATLFEDSLGSKFSPRAIAAVQRAAFDVGEDVASAGIGESLFQKTRDASVAFLVACACSRLGRIEDGFRWLRRAREQGFERRDVLDSDPSLEPLRTRPEWAELRASFEG